MIQEANLLTTSLGKSITNNFMMGMKQPDQVLLLTEMVGSVKFLVGIMNPFMNHTANLAYPTIQPTIIQSNQETVPEHIDWD